MADKDITNQELLDALTQQLATISDNMVARQDVEEIVEGKIQQAVKGLATKDELNSAVLRIERKLSSYQKANVNHHLETRSQIGKLSKELGQMCEGLAIVASLA